MEERNFMQLLRARQDGGCHVCVGLDSDTDNKKFPHDIVMRRSIRSKVREFNKRIVDVTAEFAACYKINVAFYEQHGPDGLMGIGDTIDNIRHDHPGIPVILDAKRGDIGNTNNGYVKAAFQFLEADAITVPPYMGKESLKPFLELANNGVFVLVRTSNPGAGEFQDLLVDTNRHPDGHMPLYQYVALSIATDWNENENCGVVVGATAPEELEQVRKIIGPDMQILIPGVGAQGGDLEASVHAAIGEEHSRRFIINLSRSVIFASSGQDFAKAAGEETERVTCAIRNTLPAIAS